MLKEKVIYRKYISRFRSVRGCYDVSEIVSIEIKSVGQQQLQLRTRQGQNIHLVRKDLF